MVRWPSDVSHPFCLPNLNLDLSLLVKVSWVKAIAPCSCALKHGLSTVFVPLAGFYTVYSLTNVD